MSLNKFSNDTIKSYLSLGCNTINCNNLTTTEIKVGDIQCDSLEINGVPIIPSQDHTDSASFNPILSLSNCSLGNYSAYYSYNKNVMTVIINAAFTVTTNASFSAFEFSCPPNYEVKVNLERYPAVGTMSNNVSTPFTIFDTFTQTSNNFITCDFNKNGVDMIAGQIGRLCYTGTFLVNPI